MKYRFITIGLITLILSSFALPAMAQIRITNVRVYEISNTIARIKWRTPYTETKGIIYYGLDPTNLDMQMGYNAYKYLHESALTGIETDETYYFRIIAIDSLGNQASTYVMSFSTDDILDTIAPRIYDEQTIQVTGDAVAVSWRTNEKTKGYIYYSANGPSFEKRARIGSYKKKHDTIIYKLDPNVRYLLKIVATDKAGNQRTSKIITFNTSSQSVTKPALEIEQIQLVSVEDNQVLIKWRTNLVAKGRVYYGTSHKRLSKRVDVSQSPRQLQHEALLPELDPGQTYYYKIRAYDSLYKKTLDASVQTFITSGSIVIVDTSGQSNDSDSDGLSDDYELEIGTDPFSVDTDGDGYDDGLEISNGYDPKGLGRWLAKIFAYLRPRASNNLESDKAQELRSLIEDELGRLTISLKDWYVLVNAYIYGNYPVEAIVQAVKFGGKTVHPNIPWEAWSHSVDYLEYINK